MGTPRMNRERSRGITPVAKEVLDVLRRRQPCTVYQIAHETKLSCSRVSNALDNLDFNGILTQEHDGKVSLFDAE
jgi:DNA-binding IclR family transcriptional regulator